MMLWVTDICVINQCMRTIISPQFDKAYFAKSVVTVGNFDGVHRGHREVFGKLARRAVEHDALSVVVTFEPHPLKVISPLSAPALITTMEQKRRLIEESDVDVLIVFKFDAFFSEITAERFVTDVFSGMLGAKHIIIGHDYAFGKGRLGNEALLRGLGSQLGFNVEALDPVGDGQLVFSSSMVRKLISNGDILGANEILGRSFSLSGTVVHGREIGRSIGFPTANIVTANELIPADGVYAVWVEAGGHLYSGACSIGNNPTFEGGGRTIEVFLLDYQGDLYSQQINIFFEGRVREIRKFSDSSLLVEQIRQDILKIRSILEAGLPGRLAATEH